MKIIEILSINSFSKDIFNNKYKFIIKIYYINFIYY